jgi:hypothetical protein
MSKLQCRISRRSVKGAVRYEGLINAAGVAPTKLQKGDGETGYTTRAAVVAAANRWATKHGYGGVNFGGTDVEGRPAPAGRTTAAKAAVTLLAE